MFYVVKLKKLKGNSRWIYSLGYYNSCVVCVKYNCKILNCHLILITVIEEYIFMWKKMSLIDSGSIAILNFFWRRETLSQVY